MSTPFMLQRISTKETKMGLKYTVKYFEVLRGGKVNKQSCECHEPPREELDNAMGALKEFFLEVMGLPSAYASGLTITDVALGEDELRNTTLNIRATKMTGFTVDPALMETKPVPVGSGPVVVLIQDMETEAEKYVRGLRKQGDLFRIESAGQKAMDALGELKKVSKRAGATSMVFDDGKTQTEISLVGDEDDDEDFETGESEQEETELAEA